MSLRIRQIALAARELSPVVEEIEKVFGLDVAFRDPGVGAFGLHNAVLPIGTQFLEVVSPLKEGTTAGRLIERRGDSGYMVIFQTDDLDRDRARLGKLGVRVVWDCALDDIRAAHLHPKDIGGAIVSLDQPVPSASWRWGGPEWQRHVRTESVGAIVGAELEARDPEGMARRWGEVLGLAAPRRDGDSFRLDVEGGALTFVPERGRGEGLAAFSLAARSPGACVGRAREIGLPSGEGTVTVAGTRIDLVG
jgi:hypothetical protein